MKVHGRFRAPLYAGYFPGGFADRHPFQDLSFLDSQLDGGGGAGEGGVVPGGFPLSRSMVKSFP